MYGFENWTTKKAEQWRIDAFELWCWRRLFSIACTARWSNRQSIGRIDSEAPIVWPPEWKNWLIGKDPDAGKDWKQEEKGTTEYGMVGWHHWLNGHEFKQALGVGDGQGILVCCSHGVTESDMTERLNWTELVVLSIVFNMSFNRQYLKAGSWNHWHVIW